MKNLVYLLILILLIWMGVGSWYYGQKCCDGPDDFPSLTIADGDRFSEGPGENILFAKGENVPEVSSETAGILAKLKDYLIANPDRQLLLTGHYSGSEGNNTSFENLGLGRASAIRDYLTKLGIPASRMNIEGLADNGLTFNGGKLRGGVDFSFSDISPNYGTINIKDGTNFSASFEGPLRIPENGFEFDQPLKADASDALTKLAAYLKANPGKVVTIKGFYNPNENNTSMFSNLGEARANSMRAYLVSLGCDPASIEISGESRDGLLPSGGFIMNPFSFSFGSVPTPTPTPPLESRILYFDYNASAPNLDPDLRKYLTDCVNYLSKKPEARINVIGHTDAIGSAESNQVLGQRRAANVRDYFIKNGVNAAQIVTSSKGETVPVASNDTEDGRKLNRRAEVILK